ncbi:MAG: FHA domain-containing protein [Planctomycetota bacterium]|jgi:pSer/pThr/pTyr-binding forkhead associated (FHA) protein
MATLVITQGPAEGRCIQLRRGDRLVSIGRDDQCTFQLVDEHISRRHLQIRYEEQEDLHYAVDMRSANGVFVNGKQIVESKLLKEGDVIRIGHTTIRYTRNDFPDEQSAIDHYKKTDEWKRSTIQ